MLSLVSLAHRVWQAEVCPLHFRLEAPVWKMLWTSHLGTTTLQFKMAVEGSLQRHCGTYCNLEPEQHSSACPLAQSCLTLCDLMDCSLPGTLVMGFSRQEYWSGLPFPSPGDLPDPGIEPGLPHCRQTLYRLSYQGSPWAFYPVPIRTPL